MLCSGISGHETVQVRRLQATVHDDSVRHVAERLECFIASDASAVVEHTKQ